MDALLGTHSAFLLGSPWLRDAEGWADGASTPYQGELLMQVSLYCTVFDAMQSPYV